MLGRKPEISFLKRCLKKLSDKSMTTWVAKQMHSALDTETVQKGAERTGRSHFSIQINAQNYNSFCKYY